jgi:hypothetical protein
LGYLPLGNQFAVCDFDLVLWWLGDLHLENGFEFGIFGVVAFG